jgi:hypothetical protein
MKVRTERLSIATYPEELERYKQWAEKHGTGNVSKAIRDLIELGMKVADTQQKAA